MIKRKLVVVLFVLGITAGNLYAVSANDSKSKYSEEKYEKQYIGTYMDDVVSAEHDFLEPKQDKNLRFSNEVNEPFNELELKLLENKKRAEYVDSYNGNELKSDSSSLIEDEDNEPEILSYDMDQSIMAEIVEFDFFENDDYYDAIADNEFHVWFVPAIDKDNENVTLSISKKDESSSMYPDAIYKTASGDDYINLEIVYENMDADIDEEDVSYVKYFNSIIAIVPNDDGDVVIPIVNGQTVGLIEEKAYDLDEAFSTIVDYLS